MESKQELWHSNDITEMVGDGQDKKTALYKGSILLCEGEQQ